METGKKEESEEKAKIKKKNIFQQLAEDSIKLGGIWNAQPSKANRDEKREDDTGSARNNKFYWNSNWWK
ncbi:hypothetical protein L3Y34_010517 [Caenorhabditis briggsae]|uniref:Uncharacterized protein n=1 Tax=Caenorhabditis briggsae TaxID=6238 RepID=A0AAE8ZRR1_CAEBR|nr:hypothetical protein L3Y34_010517 [Caenorhabditis briggsae]